MFDELISLLNVTVAAMAEGRMPRAAAFHPFIMGSLWVSVGNDTGPIIAGGLT